jgi:hypothetical protein
VFVYFIFVFSNFRISAFTFKIELRQSLCGTGVGVHTRGTGEYVPGPSVHVMRYKVCLEKMKKIV